MCFVFSESSLNRCGCRKRGELKPKYANTICGQRGVKKCITLKNHASIRKETIKLIPVRDEQGNLMQELELMFDSNYECMITVYICATEIRNASATPLL